MHCGSMSKSLAPGYRLGWTAAGRFARSVERLKLSSTLSVAVPSQLAVLRYLLAGGFDMHLRHLRATLARQQEEALRCIARYFPAQARVTRPSGGYFIWVELPARVDALEVHRLALSHSISVAPGPLFSADRRFRHHLRLNYGHPRFEQLEPALKTLGRLVAGLMKRPVADAPR